MMKASLALVVFSFALIGGSAALVAASDGGGAPASPQVEKAVKNSEGWPVLKTGMPAEDVLRLIGKPDSIKPMDTKDGKAEVWTYRREVSRSTQQTAATMESIPVFTGMGLGNDATGSMSVPVYRLEHIVVYQVSSLLMFEGKMVAATQKAEREHRFD